MRGVAVTAVAVGLLAAGCVTTERARFLPGQGQSQLIRDGRDGVSSVGKNTIVILSRAGRDIPRNQRVGFVVGVQNRGAAPATFRVEDVEVVQSMPDNSERRIAIVTHEQLQSEERVRQVTAAILVGLAAGANAAAAANAGHWRSNTTIYTPRGSYIATTTGYSPALASAASANAAAQNAAMIDASIAQGHANLARLEREYIKDHTILPGEWYGGLMAMEAPAGDAGADKAKQYEIRLRVGPDLHRFRVVQEPNQR